MPRRIVRPMGPVRPASPNLAANVNTVIGVLQKEPAPFPRYSPTLSPIPYEMTRNAGPPNNSAADTRLPANQRPSVVVTDIDNNPVENVRVRFEVISGGGHVSSANQLTDANGVATVGSWTLGKATVHKGRNALEAYISPAVPPGHTPDRKNPFPKLSVIFKTRV
jgi:hypothetical protein